MKVPRRCSFACLFLPFFVASGRTDAASPSTEGMCAGQPLYAKHATIETGRIKSPDGSKTLLVKSLYDEKRDQYVSMILHDGKSTYVARLAGWAPEILWSPDSSRFAVNQTVGGGGIGQEAYVFSVIAGRLRRIDVFRPLEKAFGSPVKCEVPVPPNTAIIKWLDANMVLVIAEVVPVSICKCSGSFRSYVVSLTDLSIKRSYSQAETTRFFSDSLGCELQNPQSACVIGEWKQDSGKRHSVTR
jgi:hypothetical protein